MNEERRETPTAFATRLIDHLAGLADPKVPLPSAADLATLVEITFYASLHEDEARRTRFNVAWEPHARECDAFLEITVPVTATPGNLAKLAPATRHEASSIAVRRDGDELVAWALLDRAASDPPPLTIRVLGPGVIRVDYAGAPRALYVRGASYFLGGGHQVLSPARTLTSAFKRWTAEADPHGIDLRAAVIIRIAATTLEHGHGGMLLVVPADTEPQGVRVHYPVGNGAGLLAARFGDVIEGVPPADRLARLVGSRLRGSDGRVFVRDEPQIAFAEAIELIARLTATDNAVVLDTELRLRGFGAQVIAGASRDATFEHANPYTRTVHLDDLATFKGTRHPAGVMFCMRQDREAAAIIASQDGQLSLAVKDARDVVSVLGSYESAFGWK